MGTPKYFREADGRFIKTIDFDSFGSLRFDDLPDIFIPIGFAGGLRDRDTHLVHFGYRDYDPRTGRFTAKDPARDRRGDGDVYDYCVDDPVGSVDPSGLWTSENKSTYPIRDTVSNKPVIDLYEKKIADEEKKISSFIEQYGPYRGKEIGVYRDDPVIFSKDQDNPDQLIQIIAGSLTP